MTARRATALVAVAAVVAAAVLGGFRLLRSSSAITAASSPVVPTARVTRGAMTLTVYLQGELRATRQANLTAPAVGGALRILSVVGTGTQVTKDDPLMEFDPADQQYALEQAESELLEAEQELIKRRAEIKAQEAQDKVGLLTAQFDVRRAALDAAVDADLIPANDYKIRQAEVEEAKRNLTRIEQDIKSRATTSKASLAVLEERKMRSEMAAARARQNMDNLVLRAPMDGVVSVRDNMDAGGGMLFQGMSLPAYRVGDTVYSGRPVMDVLDLATMEVRARVNEQERANVAVGQTARLEVDAIPDISPTARVSSVAGLGRPDSRYGPLRQFDVMLELRDPDPRLKPGTTVRVLVAGETVKNVLLLPRQALFEIDGKPTVYVRAGGSDAFSPRQIKVVHRTESQVAIDGVDEGIEVALVDPVAAMKLSGAPSSGSGPLDIKK
jgi:multidrug efflux pump subunit AcrA (membrane-fusion protein)